MNILRVIINFLDYPLRQLIHWHRGILTFVNEDKTRLFKNLPPDLAEEADSSAKHFLDKYHLQSLYENSTKESYLYNLYYLELLERAFEQVPFEFPESIFAVDLGASSWFYVQSLYGFLKYWHSPSGRQVTLTGYEIDPYRIYSNLHSRYDHALTNIQGLHGVEYIPRKFAALPEHFDLTFMFFPFIFMKDHLEWGLPSNQYDPGELLKIAIDSTKPSGGLILLNQSIEENKAQVDLLKIFGRKPEVTFKNESLFYTYPIPHYVSVVRK